MIKSSAHQKDYDRVLNITFYGEYGTGKTSMINSYTYNQYDINKPTIGIDFQVTNQTVNGFRYRIMLWDPSGLDLRYIKPTGFFRKTNGVILIYSIDSRKSFDELDTLWVNHINSCCPIEVPKILVGQKSDLETNRKVTFAEGEKLAQKLGYKFFECSSKMKINTVETIEYMFDEASKYEIKLDSNNNPVHNLKQENPKKLVGKCFS